MRPRYVIVVEFHGYPPQVFGPWMTRERAEQQCARWERRIERSGVTRGVLLSVAMVFDQSAASFAGIFQAATGYELHH